MEDNSFTIKCNKCGHETHIKLDELGRMVVGDNMRLSINPWTGCIEIVCEICKNHIKNTN